MPLGNVVLSRHVPLGVSERDILQFRKIGYADINKRGDSSEKVDMMVFPYHVSS